MSDTSKYQPPKFVVKPALGDKGYEMVRKNYNRFIWTWNDYVKNATGPSKGETKNKNKKD